MQNFEHFSDMEFDVLREIGNIGAGNAATALADILGDRILISVPQLQIIDVGEITSLLGGPENLVAGLLVNMEQDVKGMLLYILGKEFVATILETLLGEPVHELTDVSEIGRSALMEISNILSGSYIKALSSFTGLDIRLSTPQSAIDMVGAILNYPAAQFGEMGDKLLLIEENFITSAAQVKSHLLIMPEPHSMQEIFKRLGISE